VTEKRATIGHGGIYTEWNYNIITPMYKIDWRIMKSVRCRQLVPYAEGLFRIPDDGQSPETQ
jgi:hypothetical protein